MGNKKPTSPEIQAEQIQLLYKHFPFMSVANIPSVLILGFVLYGNISNSMLIPWFLAINLSILLRLILSKQFQKKERKINEILIWGNYALASVFFSGLLWALLAYMSTFAGENEFFIISFFLVLMAAVFLAPGSTLRPAFHLFSIPIIVSIAISFLFIFEEYLFTSILLFFGLSILINLSNKFEQTLIESIQIRFEKQSLIIELNKQKQEAERANLAKSKFLAAASHDLRQPLHALSLYMDTMNTELSTQRQIKLAEKMAIAIDALNDLFQRLLDISKLDAGIVEPHRSDYLITDLFARLDIRFTPLAKTQNLLFSIKHNDEIFFSDPILIERILDNLISNAIRYTTKGEVNITSTQKNGQIIIAVADTGSGIPNTEQENIFTEFYQLHNPERDRTKGLGLGLSIVKRLCLLLGHQLNIKSSIEQGSTFYLHLPVGNHKNIPKNHNNETPHTWDINNLHILVIDDEMDIRDAMHELLSTWGCQVTCAESAEEAISIIKNEPEPKLIIADYRLRESKTGVDAIHTIEKQLNKKIPGILITGDTAPERLQEAANSGFKLLHKPVNPSQLRIIINHLLAKN